METEGLIARTRPPNVKSRQGRRLSNAQAQSLAARARPKGERESTVPRLIFWASGLALGPCSPRGPTRPPLSPLSPSPRSEELGRGSGEGKSAWRAACKPSREPRMSTQFFPAAPIPTKTTRKLSWRIPALSRVATGTAPHNATLANPIHRVLCIPAQSYLYTCDVRAYNKAPQKSSFESLTCSYGHSTGTLTLIEPQSGFGDKPLKRHVVCPQNGTAVLKGLSVRYGIPYGCLSYPQGCALFTGILRLPSLPLPMTQTP